jgi:hypothetical protein
VVQVPGLGCLTFGFSGPVLVMTNFGMAVPLMFLYKNLILFDLGSTTVQEFDSKGVSALEPEGLEVTASNSGCFAFPSLWEHPRVRWKS